MSTAQIVYGAASNVLTIINDATNAQRRAISFGSLPNQITSSVIVKALLANAGIVILGDVNLAAGGPGVELNPGDEITLPAMETIYYTASVAGPLSFVIWIFR